MSKNFLTCTKYNVFLTHTLNYLAARLGLEPRLSGPEPGVLPLDDLALVRINIVNIELTNATTRLFQAYNSAGSIDLPY